MQEAPPGRLIGTHRRFSADEYLRAVPLAMAYEYRCAFCGFDGLLDGSLVGLEAGGLPQRPRRKPPAERLPHRRRTPRDMAHARGFPQSGPSFLKQPCPKQVADFACA